MEMSIPCGIRAEISQNGDISGITCGYRENIETTMPAERRGNHRSRGMSRSYPYALKYSAEV